LASSKLQVSYFLDERKAALAYVNLDNSFEELANEKRLATVFSRLRKAFGGFVDLGLIDARGIQQAYVGPYNLEGHNYKNQDWYQEVMIRGIYISDVFLGHRNFPHFVIAVRHESDTEPPYVLRATIDTDRLNSLMKAQDVRRGGDLFLVNQAGMLQTSSELYGQVLTKFPLMSKMKPMKKGIYQVQDAATPPLAVGLAKVEGTPFKLVAINKPKALLHKWDTLRINVMIMVGISVIAMLLVIYWGSNTLVGRIYDADLRRVSMLHEMEYTNKLASIGRLAAGVAHEINNPVAIINEKVGLMTDILAHAEGFPLKEKFIKQAEVIKDSVRRVSRITHRLLGFARHLPIKSEPIHLADLIEEVLGLLGREAEYRNIAINLDQDPETPPIMADKGQLQQVFLNILNNALAAVSDGGRIDIKVAELDPDRVEISFKDDGEGISPENLKNVFEPFFSTKGEKGTGLGLSITYGIVQKMGGNIFVESKLGEGTTFRLLLPRQYHTDQKPAEEEVVSRGVSGRETTGKEN
jgi:signal transduction histidine kinase